MPSPCTETPTPKPFKERMLELRTAIGLSQDTVAERGGIPRLRVADIERGKNKLRVRETFKGVAKGLGLLEGELDDFIAMKVTARVLADRVLRRDPDVRAAVSPIVSARFRDAG
jgi:transcriptional regulator with XRE-family HTH domain